MSRRQYNLPPLTSLAAFEAAARHESFKQAAQELSVTPGAVSHQIKALEAELACPLFQRRHRGVELTDEGRLLSAALAGAFGDLARVVDVIRQRADRARVVVGATTAVASLWISPAILRFWRAHSQVDVSQVAQDQPFVGRSDLDFYIRYGRDPDETLMQTPLYRDVLVPVAAPELAARLQGADLDAVAAQRLIHLSSSRNWTGWPDWFQALGHAGSVPNGVQVTNYALALQMAAEGGGLVLGWRRLIAPLLRDGRLQVIAPHAVQAPRLFYLVGRPESDLSPSARALKQWIQDELAQNSDELNSTKGENFSY